MQDYLRDMLPSSRRDGKSSSRSSRSNLSRLSGRDAGAPSTSSLRNIQPCFDPLQTLADSLGVPLACLRLDRHGVTERKTFVNYVKSQQASGLVLPSRLSTLLHHTTPGQAAPTPGVDEEGGKTIFCVGSIVKLFINLAFCILVHQKNIQGLAWDSRVFDLYDSNSKSEPPLPRLDSNPTLRDLLLHEGSYQPILRFLLSPDGAFLPTSAEFLQHAALWSNHLSKIHKTASSLYSNANHIFAALLLERLTGKSFATAMQETIFGPLNMARTTADPFWLEMLEDGNIAEGHRLSRDHTQYTVVPRRYLVDTIQAASFGTRSCADDIAALFREVFAAYNGQGAILTPDVLKSFLGRYNQLAPVNTTLSGTYCSLESGAIGSESLNVYSRPVDATSPLPLGTRAGKSVYCFYKGGIVDGFTCCVCVSIAHSMSLVILANTTGPTDFCDYALRYMLQEVFETTPRVDILGEAAADLQSAKLELAPLYRAAEGLTWSDSCNIFAGTFEHVKHKQKLTVSSLGKVRFHGGAGQSEVFNAVVVGRKLHIIVMENETAVDHRHEWKHLNFELLQILDKVYLRADGDVDYYQKLSDT